MADLTSFSIQPVTYADINSLAKIGGDAFVMDRHTQVKQLGKVPYNMEEMAKESLPNNLNSERYVYMKAVNDATGEAIGYVGLVFCGIKMEQVPRLDPGKPEAKLRDEKQPEEKQKQEETHKMKEEEEEDDDDEDSIARLHAMEEEDMKRWQGILMPKGTKCMIVVGLNVAPKFQSRGVGSALLKWGTDVADRLGVFAWVHSSEAAWKTYARHGFEVVGILDIDLDAWAPAAPKEEGEGAIWVHYVCRYMKRSPIAHHYSPTTTAHLSPLRRDSQDSK